MIRLVLIIASLYGGLAVCTGAFGAHALGSQLSERMLSVWHTAVQYQMYHALALLAVGLMMRLGLDGTPITIAAWAFVLGTLLFSGSLYLLATTGIKALGPVTPIGGMTLIVGWIALLVGIWRSTAS